MQLGSLFSKSSSGIVKGHGEDDDRRCAPPQANSYNSSSASIDSIQIPVGPRLGNDVVTAAGLQKAYGERLLIDGASFTVPAGAIVGA